MDYIFVIKRKQHSWVLCCTPIIPATWETEIGESQFEAQVKKLVVERLPCKPQALSSEFSSQRERERERERE
jgi:hypothetical protein